MKRGRATRLLVALAGLLASLGTADITFEEPLEFVGGQSLISQSNVAYVFKLAYTVPLTSANSKLTIRFPVQFETEFQNVRCSAVAGFSVSEGTDLNCDYNSAVRLVTIQQGFPLNSNQPQLAYFKIEGVVNPPYALETDSFTIQSFELAGSSWSIKEDSSNTMTITPTAGALSQMSLSLPPATKVGEYAEMTVTLRPSHNVPQDGRIEIDLPKWNWFATSANDYESFVATSTSPGSVVCAAVQNIPLSSSSSNALNCIFEHGTTRDTLYVNFDGYLSAQIARDQDVVFTVEGVRGPPSTSAVSDITIRTTGAAANSVIDETAPGAQIDLQVTQKAVSFSSYMQVQPRDPSINAQTALQLTVKPLNPLMPSSSI